MIHVEFEVSGSSEGRTITDSSLVEAVLSEAPTLKQTLTKQFLDLFKNRFGSLSKQIKESGRWIELSRFHNLSDEEILEALSPESKVLRACRADDMTSFLAITIQTVSYYSSAEGLSHLRECLKASGVERAKLYQSSDDCALNLFIFLDQPTPSTEGASLLSRALRRHGVVPGTAGLNVFPSESGFCLPLQPGFAWINDEGQVIVSREQITLEAALALFFADFQKNRISTEALIACLKAQVSSGPTNIKSIHDVDPAKVQSTTQTTPQAQPSSATPAPPAVPPTNVSGEFSMPTNVVQWKAREKQAEEKQPEKEPVKKNTFETVVDSAFDAVADLSFEPPIERSLKTVSELLESAPDAVESAFEAGQIEILDSALEVIECTEEVVIAQLQEVAQPALIFETESALDEVLEVVSTNVSEEKTETLSGAASKLIAELKAEAESATDSDEETAYSWMHRTASTLESDDYESDGDVLPEVESESSEEEEDFSPGSSSTSDPLQHEGPIPTPSEYIKDYQQLRFFD